MMTIYEEDRMNLEDVSENRWYAIATMMDDDTRETVHAELAPCTRTAFLKRYLELDEDFIDVLTNEFGFEEDEEMTYYLEFGNGDTFRLNTNGEGNTVYEGHLSDLGIEENDPEYTNKLDDFFEKELGISASEWEVG